MDLLPRIAEPLIKSPAHGFLKNQLIHSICFTNLSVDENGVTGCVLIWLPNFTTSVVSAVFTSMYVFPTKKSSLDTPPILFHVLYKNNLGQFHLAGGYQEKIQPVYWIKSG